MWIVLFPLIRTHAGFEPTSLTASDFKSDSLTTRTMCLQYKNNSKLDYKKQITSHSFHYRYLVGLPDNFMHHNGIVLCNIQSSS